MELRWYQTYDKFGRDSSVSLQFFNEDSNEWEDVPFVREREDEPEEEEI